MPELIELAEFDEYNGDGIMRELLPQLSAQDERFRQLNRRARNEEAWG